MSSCRVNVKCSDINTIKNIIENAEFQQESESVLFSTNELLMYDRLYKIITICSKLSTMESFRYMRKNKINYSNMSFVIQIYEKKLFNTFMCYITALHNLVLCIKRTNVDVDQKLVESFTVNEIIKNMTDLFEYIYQNRDSIDFQTIEVLLSQNVITLIDDKFPNCKEEFLEEFENCKKNYFSDIPEVITGINIYKDSLTKSTLSTKDGKDIVMSISDKNDKDIPNYKLSFFNRLTSTLCWFLNSVGSVIPEPVSSSFNYLIYFSSIFANIGGLPVTGFQLIRLASTFLGAKPKTLSMFDDIIKLTEDSYSFSKQLVSLNEGVKLLTISKKGLDPKAIKKIEAEQLQYTQQLTKSIQKLTAKKYKKTVKAEKKKEKELALEAAKKLAEKKELDNLQEIYQKWGDVDRQNLVSICRNLLQEIDQKTEEYLELKEEYKNLPRPVFFWMHKNMKQKENLLRQRECLRIIQKKIALLSSQSITIDKDDPFHNEMYEVLKRIKDLSYANQLGLSEIYNALDEEFDETPTGWSYDILRAINDRMPQALSGRKIHLISQIVPPVEKIDSAALALTAASLVPLVRVRGVKNNLMYQLKSYRVQLIEKGIIKKPRGKLPELKGKPSIYLEPKGGTTAFLWTLGALGFNGYLYGNYVQKNIYEKMKRPRIGET